MPQLVESCGMFYLYPFPSAYSIHSPYLMKTFSSFQKKHSLYLRKVFLFLRQLKFLHYLCKQNKKDNHESTHSKYK